VQRRKLWAIGAIGVIVVAIAAYAAGNYLQNYNSPLSKCERDASNGDSGVGNTVIVASLAVPSGSDQGNLTMTAYPNGCAPFAGVSITFVSPALGGLTNQSFLRYDGTVVSANRPAPIGATRASGSIEVFDASANQSYKTTAEVTYATSAPEFTNSTVGIGLTSQS